jgi:hypothetical protein
MKTFILLALVQLGGCGQGTDDDTGDQPAPVVTKTDAGSSSSPAAPATPKFSCTPAAWFCTADRAQLWVCTHNGDDAAAYSDCAMQGLKCSTSGCPAGLKACCQ